MSAPRRSAVRAARSALIVGLTAVAVTILPAAAMAIPSETIGAIKASFSPNRLGAKTAFTFTTHFSGGELGVPAPVRKAVVHFPAGLRLDVPSFRECTRARLQAHGARGCPSRSQLGSGHALADVHAGSTVESEEATVWAFLGPLQGGQPTILILGQGYTPLYERVVITGTVLPDKAPYGEQLVMSIPPIPTIPLEPDASTVSFTLKVSGKTHGKGHRAGWVVLPSRCPTGGFPFAAEFSYADGSTSSTSTTAPCP
jgi:hypothetical protein